MEPNNEAGLPKIEKSSQEIDNLSFDTTHNVRVSENLGYDGQGLQRQLADNMAIKITEVGSVTYIGMARPGTPQDQPYWQCKKIDETSGMVITWAGGTADFVHVATDLTALDYS